MPDLPPFSMLGPVGEWPALIAAVRADAEADRALLDRLAAGCAQIVVDAPQRLAGWLAAGVEPAARLLLACGRGALGGWRDLVTTGLLPLLADPGRGAPTRAFDALGHLVIARWLGADAPPLPEASRLDALVRRVAAAGGGRPGAAIVLPALGRDDLLPVIRPTPQAVAELSDRSAWASLADDLVASPARSWSVGYALHAWRRVLARFPLQYTGGDARMIDLIGAALVVGRRGERWAAGDDAALGRWIDCAASPTHLSLSERATLDAIEAGEPAPDAMVLDALVRRGLVSDRGALTAYGRGHPPPRDAVDRDVALLAEGFGAPDDAAHRRRIFFADDRRAAAVIRRADPWTDTWASFLGFANLSPPAAAAMLEALMAAGDHDRVVARLRSHVVGPPYHLQTDIYSPLLDAPRWTALLRWLLAAPSRAQRCWGVYASLGTGFDRELAPALRALLSTDDPVEAQILDLIARREVERPMRAACRA